MGVPTGSDFAVEARAHNGEISNDFSLTNTNENNSNTLSAEVGKGGPKIVLTSDQGDIHLSKAEMVAPLPPVPPVLPVPKREGCGTPVAAECLVCPKAPKVPAPGKHLKAPDGATEPPVVQQ